MFIKSLVKKDYLTTVNEKPIAEALTFWRNLI